MRTAAALLLLLVPTVAWGQSGSIPDGSYGPELLYQHVSPTMGEGHAQNQPHIVDGHLLLAGNAHFELWDIADPFAPTQLSVFDSLYDVGEAESHQVTTGRTSDGRTIAVTISGFGVDVWDLTDLTEPALLADVILDGIDYGDNAEAVWGVALQGRTLYVGGTSTGLHILDLTDPAAPELLARVPTAELGGVSAGPLYAVGNLLVVTPPKDHEGIVTLDIGDPAEPALLDVVVPTPDTYIGAFYGREAWHLTPLRAWDVTTDPTDIVPTSSRETPETEYVSFADGFAFVGRLRPNPGLLKIDLADPEAEAVYIEGRRDDVANGFFTDDQFTLPVGNLVVLGDDEIRYGAVLAVHDTERDVVPPRVAWVSPPEGSVSQPVSSRIGVSLTDQIDLRSAGPESLILRPVGGEPVSGSWGLTQTVLSFEPDLPLEPDTAYEILLPAGGLTDLVGNPLAEAWHSTFTTGANALPPCAIEGLGPAEVGTPVELALAAADAARIVTWQFGDGVSAEGLSVTHAWDEPGRHLVTATVDGKVGRRVCTGVQVVGMIPASTPPVRSGTLLVLPEGDVLVANPDAGTVSRVSLDGGLVWEEDVGGDVRGLAWDGSRAVAVTRDTDRLVTLDPDGGVVSRRDLPWGTRASGAAVDDLGLVLATESVLDDGVSARAVALTPDGDLLLPRFVSPQGSGELIRMDLDGRVTVIPLPIDPGPDTDRSGRGVPNLLAGIAVSPDGSRAWIAGSKANVERGLVRDGELPNPHNTVRAMVAVIDLERNREIVDLRIDLDDHEGAVAVEVAPRGDLIFVASRGTHRVDVFDAATSDHVAAIGTGAGPIDVRIDGDTLIVHEWLDRTVSTWDIGALLDGTDTLVQKLGTVSAVSELPLTEQLRLGQRVFFDASDRRMSQDGYLSCATCHPDGASDERVWDFTNRGEGLRNTTDLRGRAGLAHGPVHWTGNFDEIQDFEHDIRGHFGGSGFMTAADFAATSGPLDAPKAGLSEHLDALAAYVATFDAPPRSPWRNPDGTLSDDALAGQRIYERLDCADCHPAPTYTDSAPGVRHDVGTLTDASGQRMGGALDGIDTPTLHGLHASAPYFHDGGATFLEQTLFVEGHGNAQQLTQEQTRKLLVFLLSLDGQPVAPVSGCGCALTDGITGVSLWALLVPLLAVRRRR